MGFIFRVFLDGIWFPIFLTILGKRFTRKRTASPIRIRIVATMAIRIKSNLIVTAGIGLYYRHISLGKREKIISFPVPGEDKRGSSGRPENRS